MSKSPVKNGFLTWNKDELINKIDNIEIFKQGEQVITKYYNRIVSTANVSNRYEIFDIKSFIKSKIDLIEENFNILFYNFKVNKGVQYLILISDEVEINKTTYYKSFYILNSSDKSRRLNMNMGLYRSDNNSYFISSINNFSLTKKHLTGLTEKAEEVSGSIDVESFDEQIKSIQSLVGEKVSLSKVRDIIIDKDQKVNHQKFDAFKNSLRYSITDKLTSLTDEQYNVLRTPSEFLELNSSNDFTIDAYKVFNCYMQVFSNQDSYIIKKETEKILMITQCFIRDEKINQILDLID